MWWREAVPTCPQPEQVSDERLAIGRCIDRDRHCRSGRRRREIDRRRDVPPEARDQSLGVAETARCRRLATPGRAAGPQPPSPDKPERRRRNSASFADGLAPSGAKPHRRTDDEQDAQRGKRKIAPLSRGRSIADREQFVLHVVPSCRMNGCPGSSPRSRRIVRQHYSVSSWSCQSTIGQVSEAAT